MCAKINRQRTTQSGEPLTEEQKIELNEGNKNPHEGLLFEYSKADPAPGQVGSVLVGAGSEYNYNIGENEKCIKNCKRLISLIEKVLFVEQQKLQTINIAVVQACILCAQSYLIFHKKIPKGNEILRKIVEQHAINKSVFLGTYTKPLKSLAKKINKADGKEKIDRIMNLSESDIQTYLLFLGKLKGEIREFNKIKSTITPNKRDFQKIYNAFPGIGTLLANKQNPNMHIPIDKLDRLKYDDIKLLLEHDIIPYQEKFSTEQMRRNIQIDIMKQYYLSL